MMLKESFKVIIKEFHESALPDLISRHLEVNLSILGSPVKKVITIIGARRAGKTTFLFQLMKELMAAGTDKTNIIYVNFEDERILPLRAEELHLILDAYFELYEKSEHPFIFLDEVQNIEGWDKFVRRLNDQGFNIFITGSNSRMLGREIATSLRGRTLTYEIFPFSFSEYLDAKNIIFEKEAVYGKRRYQIRQQFDTYFFSGGYPEITLIEEKSMQGKIIQDYFDAVFYRDLIDRYKIRNSELMRMWLTTLMANVSSLISYSKIENDFRSRGIKLSRATLSTFAGYVEDILFGFFVPIYSESERKRQINPKKFYLIDHGLHNYLTLRFSENKGRLLENLVFLELRRKGKQVCYYRSKGGYEVDFLLDENGEKKLIQVCHDISRIETFNREKRAVLAGIKELGLKSGLILTFDEKRYEEIGGHLFEIIPVWEWLLSRKVK
ncbi:ATP-binding protein [bacterium]|nr:ATP-binding protein [bacterium]